MNLFLFSELYYARVNLQRAKQIINKVLFAC